MSDGEDEPTGNVHQKSPGIVRRSLADEESGHQLGFPVNARPEIHVANVAALRLLRRRQTGLLLGNVGPLLIELQVGQRQVPHSLIQESAAGIAKADDQPANRVPVNAGNAFGRADRISLQQKLQG